MYLCLRNTTVITFKSKHTVKHKDFPSAMRPVPRSEELPVPKRTENLTFIDDGFDSDEDYGQKESNNVDCDPTFEQVVPYLNPIY